VYVQKWNSSGDHAVSFLWNLYWQERRGEDLAFELFPLLAYRSEEHFSEVSVLKGLIRYQEEDGLKKLQFFWLPFGINWKERETFEPPSSGSDTRYEP